MAVSGIPQIDGYSPPQDGCVQEFSLSGYGVAPPPHEALTDAAVCERARQEGFTTVLRVESLSDRNQDRRLTCP